MLGPGESQMETLSLTITSDIPSQGPQNQKAEVRRQGRRANRAEWQNVKPDPGANSTEFMRPGSANNVARPYIMLLWRKSLNRAVEDESD